MDKMMLYIKDVKYLLDWRDKHKDLVRSAVFPMKAIRIDIVDANYSFAVIQEDGFITIHLSFNGRSYGKIVFRQYGNGMCMLIKNKTPLDHDYLESLLSVYCTAMAFMVYGKDTMEISAEEQDTEQDIKQAAGEVKERKTSKPSKKSGSKIYLLRSRTFSVPGQTGKHWKCQGEFAVRGHFRHYKTGKTVWINEYRKGSGDKKDKTYMVGA